MSKRLPNKFFPENTALNNPDNNFIMSVQEAALRGQCTNSAIHGTTQSGKTNALIFVSQELFRRLYENKGLDLRVLYVSNKSSNQIVEQTRKRFLSSESDQPSLLNLDSKVYSRGFLENHVRFEHRAGFDDGTKRGKILRWLDKGDVKLILFDEGHIAINEGGSLDHFFRHHLGIDPSEDPSNWNRDNLHLAWVSATGYVQAELKDSFNHYFVPAGSNHVSARDLHDNDKVRQITDADRESETFLRSLFSEAQNNDQHILLRYHGDDCNPNDPGSVSWIKNTVFPNEKVVEFSSKTAANPISDINSEDYWDIRRRESLILLVRGGLRVGTTLEHGLKKRLAHTVDMNSGYDQTVAQSLPGRLTGYPPDEDTVNEYVILDSKDQTKSGWIESLPVSHCNRQALENHLRYEDAVKNQEIKDNQPSSSRVGNSVKENWEFKVIDTIQETGKDGKDKFRKKNPSFTGGITSCSMNNNEDVAGRILNKDKPKPNRRAGNTPGVIHLDSPNNNHRDSWEKLMDETDFEKGHVLEATKKVKELESDYKNNGIF